MREAISNTRKNVLMMMSMLEERMVSIDKAMTWYRVGVIEPRLSKAGETFTLYCKDGNQFVLSVDRIDDLYNGLDDNGNQYYQIGDVILFIK